MKKPTRFLLGAVCALLLGAAALCLAAGKKPFRRLAASDIAWATVCLTPPGTTVQIRETGELAEYLRDLVIYQEDDSYTEYAGQGVLFTLAMKDGTQTKVMAYQPFLVIDGVGYKTKYSPCEALSGYANRLLRGENAVPVLAGPPAPEGAEGEAFCGTLPENGSSRP